MVECSVCGKDEYMPFVCKYCRKPFCVVHRLPENHECTELWMAVPPGKERPIGASARRSWSTEAPAVRLLTSTELRHLVLAWLALGFAFSVRWLFFSFSVLPTMLLISLLTVGPGFVLHELSHKFSAQRYGHWAEFRIWPMGLVMALILALATRGAIIFAAPGATYIMSRVEFFSPGISNKENGLVSLAGPLTNVLLAFVFYPISFLNGIFGLVGFTGAQVNLWLAAFNMIPLGGLDGQKVLRWSIPLWAAVTIPLWLTLFYVFF